MPKKKAFLYAEIKFPDRLFCSPEVLGKEFKISLGKFDGILAFPQLPNREEGEDNSSWMSKRLLGPEVAKTWKYSDGSQYFWGSINHAPSGHSEIDKLIIYFEKPKRSITKKSNEIYELSNKWMELFETYLVLVTKQGVHNSTTTSKYNDHIYLFYRGKDGYFKKANDTQQEIALNMSGVDTSLKRKDLLEIIKWANTLEEPHIEYMLLHESLIAYGKDDYRKSILEASLVVEMLWEKVITKELESKNINSEKLLNKFQMLGRKHELIKILEIDLPRVNYTENLIKIRNRAVHQKEKPTPQDTMKVIEATEKLLNRFLPDKTSIN